MTQRVNAKDRRGAMLVLIALLLPLFLATAAFSVDVAYMQLTRIELRISTDAAARAAGDALSRYQDQGAAIQAAKDLAAANRVAGQPLVLNESDIVFGNSSKSVNGAWVFKAHRQPINSVRINAERTRRSFQGSVPLFFARALGVDDFEPTQTATAVRIDRDICLVVDRSSSMKLRVIGDSANMSSSDPRFPLPPDMNDSRWGALDDALQEFLSALQSTSMIEAVGLVSYASEGTRAGVYNTNSDIDQHLALDHELVRQAMGQISQRVFNGSTNISAGIDNGVVVLTNPSTARPFAYKTMVLLTDGIYNQGRNPVEAAYEAAAEDIVIHTITFSDNAKQADMQAVAAATGGNHYHAPDAEDLIAIFREIALTIPVMLVE